MTEAYNSPMPGISYYHPPLTAVLNGRDGKVQIPYGDIPIPLLEEDYNSLSGSEPGYDAIGRGIYKFLRANPELPYADRYAFLLKEAYPHLLAELATFLVMLDKKDVDLPYLDRKINYLKIFALLEPENHRFPLETGTTYMEKGLTLAALNDTTPLLFRAEKYLRKAFDMNPDDLQGRFQLAEVSYLLGRYQEAASLWEGILDQLPEDAAARSRQRINQILAENISAVPPVDYLQASGCAIELFELGNYEEAAAILLDVIEALSGFDGFQIAELHYILALCYVKMDIPLYAEQYLRQALQLRPDYPEALHELAQLEGR